MPRLVHRTPRYTLHKASGKAVVTLDGQDIYLGAHGTKASRDAYDRIIGEWMANGRRAAVNPLDCTIAEVIAAFWKHAQSYYRHADGTSTGEAERFKAALRPLKRLYGATIAASFGPLSLVAVREEMIRLDWCRSTINRQIGRLRQVFKWAAAKEMIPAPVSAALLTVEGLKAGRSEAPESEPVNPVPDMTLAATLPHLSRRVRAMVDLQLFSGMRPGELCAIRGCDIDTGGKIWLYKPERHKTAHRGHSRTIYIGPKAQTVLAPFLKPDVQAFIFSPADAEAERRDALRSQRKTPLHHGNSAGTNKQRRPKKSPGNRYTVNSYRRAIVNSCEIAFEMPAELKTAAKDETTQQRRVRLDKAAQWRADHAWHPNQLRHNAATTLRREYGVDAAKIILGHKTLSATQIYAEADQAKAMKIVGEVG